MEGFWSFPRDVPSTDSKVAKGQSIVPDKAPVTRLLPHTSSAALPLPDCSSIVCLKLSSLQGLAHPVHSLRFPSMLPPPLSLSPNPRPQPGGSSHSIPAIHQSLIFPKPTQPETWGRGNLDCGVGSLGTNSWFHPPGLRVSQVAPGSLGFFIV